MRRRFAVLIAGIGFATVISACTGFQGSTHQPTNPSASPCPTNSGAVAGSAPAPPARGYHQMFGLGPTGGVGVVGGENAPPPAGGQSFMDLWAYRPPSGWVQLGTGTPRDSDGPGVFDAQSNRLILLGTYDAHYNPAAEPGNWIYEPATDHWVKRSAGDRPISNGLTMAYDAQSDRAILVTDDRRTWAYDFDHDTWTEKAPSPPTRSWFAITYDKANDRVVLFGGERFGGDLNDTWTYDYDTDTWRNTAPAKAPPGRHYSSMAYDPVSHRSILFGGAPGAQNVEKAMCDTWAYDLAKNTWTELSPKTSPPARGWHAMAFDEAIGKIVLFGGGPDRNHFQNDTWVFDSSSNNWSQVS